MNIGLPLKLFSVFRRGKKIKNPSTQQKSFFSLQTHLGTYENLYSFERLLNDLFRAIFDFKINKIIRFQGGPETPECKEFFQQI